MLLKVYNRFNILIRKTIASFSLRKGTLPLLHCSFEKIIDKNFPPFTPFYFVQAGAFDGISHDVLFNLLKKRMAAGIVIEPLPDHFDKLKENYSFNNKIIAVKSAIHNTLPEITLHRVAPEYETQLPDWAPGISSIDPMHHRKTSIPSEMMQQVKVEAKPLMILIDQYFLPAKINLLQVDTEGYDYEILKSFDFTKLIPDIIKVEYINLTAKDLDNCIKLLRHHKYYCFYDEADLIGIQLTKIRL